MGLGLELGLGLGLGLKLGLGFELELRFLMGEITARCSSVRRSCIAPTSAHVTSGMVAKPSRCAEGCTLLRPCSKSAMVTKSGASCSAFSRSCARRRLLAAWLGLGLGLGLGSGSGLGLGLGLGLA